MKMRTAYRRETAGARPFCVKRALIYGKESRINQNTSKYSTKCIDQLLLLLVVQFLDSRLTFEGGLSAGCRFIVD